MNAREHRAAAGPGDGEFLDCVAQARLLTRTITKKLGETLHLIFHRAVDTVSWPDADSSGTGLLRRVPDQADADLADPKGFEQFHGRSPSLPSRGCRPALRARENFCLYFSFFAFFVIFNFFNNIFQIFQQQHKFSITFTFTFFISIFFIFQLFFKIFLFTSISHHAIFFNNFTTCCSFHNEIL